MANGFIQVPPDSTGKKLQTFENTVGLNTVEAEAVVLVDNTGANACNVNGSGQLPVAVGNTPSVNQGTSPWLTRPTDGTNPITQTYNANTAGAEWIEGVTLRKITAGVSTELGSSGTPMRVDPTGTTTQPVSGTVTSNQGSANTIGNAWPIKITDGTHTVNVDPSGNLNFDLQQVGGSAVALGQTTMAASIPVAIASNQSSILVAQGTAAATTAGWPVIGGNIAESTAAWTSATALNTTLRMTVTGYNSVIVTLNQGTTITGGVVTFEASDTTGFTNAYPITAVQTNGFTASSTYTLQANVNQAFEIDVGGFAAFQVRLSTQISGTATVNVGIAAQAMAADPAVTVGGTVSISGTTTVSGTVSATQGTSPWVENVSQFGGSNVVTGTGASGAGIPRVTVSNDSTVGSNSATGAAVPANAFYVAGDAATALPTAASAGNLTGAMYDKFGRQVCLMGSIRDLTGTQTTTISASTAETTIVTAGAAGVFNDLVMLIISNTSAATSTRIDFRDTTAGTILFSLQSVGGAAPVGFALPIPIPQTGAATNWTAQCATSTTDIRIYAVFVKNK